MIVDNHTEMEPLWVPVKQACKMIGLGITKTYELINDGTLKTIKIGQKRLIEYQSMKNLN